MYINYSSPHLKCQVILRGSSITVAIWDGAGHNFTSKSALRVWIRSPSPTSDCKISSFYHTNPNEKYPLGGKITLFSRSVLLNRKMLAGCFVQVYRSALSKLLAKLGSSPLPGNSWPDLRFSFWCNLPANPGKRCHFINCRYRSVDSCLTNNHPEKSQPILRGKLLETTVRNMLASRKIYWTMGKTSPTYRKSTSLGRSILYTSTFVTTFSSAQSAF